jgi:hypothetical protein
VEPWKVVVGVRRFSLHWVGRRHMTTPVKMTSLLSDSRLFLERQSVAWWRDLRFPFPPHQYPEKKTGYQNSWYPGGPTEQVGCV